jgi:hypothetical protein
MQFLKISHNEFQKYSYLLIHGVHDTYIYVPAQTVVYCGSIWLKIGIAHQRFVEVCIEIEQNLWNGLMACTEEPVYVFLQTVLYYGSV